MKKLVSKDRFWAQKQFITIKREEISIAVKITNSDVYYSQNVNIRIYKHLCEKLKKVEN